MIGTVERKPAVAGQFYPGDPDRLREVVRNYIEESGVEPAPGPVRALISPHAGFMYSGATAGHAYARLAGKRPSRVLLVGCSHHYHLSRAAVFARGAFESPLGSFPIDEDHAARAADAVGESLFEPHLIEHALEVQLPFLAAAVGLVPIVPILFGASADEEHAAAGVALAELADENEVMVVSTDLSHYLSEKQAEPVDSHTIQTVLSRNWRALIEESDRGECSMCGTTAVVAAMAYASARGADRWTLLDYRTSAAASGDGSRVVGYAAVSMERGS